MMRRNIRVWCLFFLLLFSIFTSMFIAIPNNNVVVADTSVWENEYGRLEVEPSTSTNLIRQKQWYNLTWYYPDNSIDIAFGFNDSLSYGQIFYWNGGSYNKVSTGHIEYGGQHYYTISNIDVDEGETKHGYWEYDTPPGTNGKWDMYAKLSSDSWVTAFSTGRIIHLDPWWDSDWDYKKQITIDNTKVSGTSDLSNFPVLVKIDGDSDIGLSCQNDLDDIAFVDSTEATQFNHEIENYSFSGDSLTAYIWVNVTTVDHDDDTVFYIYYGNGGCANQENVTGVWDSSFTGVYHLNASSGSGSGCFDSTANSNHAVYLDNLPRQAVGKIGAGQELDGGGDSVSFPVGCHDPLNGTVEMWLSQTAVGGKGYYYNRDPLGVVTPYIVLYSDATNISFYSLAGSPGAWSMGGNFYSSEDRYFSLGWEDNAQNFRINDTSIGTATATNLQDFAFTQIWIGETHLGSGGLKGELDEIRLSNIKRSDDWRTTSYNSQGSPSTFLTFGEEDIETNTSTVSGFNAETRSHTNIYLNWTQSVNANFTYLERNTVSSWNRGDGTFLYNGTGLAYSDLNCSIYTLYYYRAWAFNESIHNFSGVSVVNNNTGPLNPSNIQTDLSGSTLNVTWVTGSRATSTVLVVKEGSYPTSATDGTVLYNGSAVGYDDASFTTSRFYKIWSFDNVTKLHSSGVETTWGVLQIRVYDENTSDVIYNYTVFVRNASKSQYYEEYSDNSQVISIDLNDLPTGEDVIIKINASVYINLTETREYEDRIYIMDIQSNTFYNLSVFLADEEITESYLIRVVDEIHNPVEGAKVDIKKYINQTFGYGDIATLLTDPNGYCTIDLIPGDSYVVDTSKDGYVSSIGYNLQPLPIVWGHEMYHTILINSESVDYESIMDNLTFDIQPEIQDHTGPIIFYFNMTSVNSELELFRMTVYQFNYTTETWEHIVTESSTTAAGGSLTFTTNNTVGLYGLKCEFQKTGWDLYTFAGEYDNLFLYTIYNVSDDTIIDDIDTIDDIIDEAIGKSPIYWGDQVVAWSSLGAALFIMLAMFTFTPKLAGFAVMSVGAVLGFFKAPLGLISDDVISMVAVVVIFILGILVVIVEGKK